MFHFMGVVKIKAPPTHRESIYGPVNKRLMATPGELPEKAQPGPGAGASLQHSPSESLVNNGCYGTLIASIPVTDNRQHPPIAMATKCITDQSTDSSSGSSSDSSESDPEQAILEDAGVDLDLSSLTVEEGKAPLALVSQLASCLLSEQYAAAQVLCEKVVALEPSNALALELQPILQERLVLNKELPTESSSSESSSESSSGDSGDTSDEDEQTSHPHPHCHSHS